MFLFLAQGYYFKHLDSQSNGPFIGEPSWSKTWQIAKLHEIPDTLFLVDENKTSIRLEDVKENENYRIRTHAAKDQGYEYIYLSWDGTNMQFYDMYLNPRQYGTHAKVKLRLAILLYVLLK